MNYLIIIDMQNDFVKNPPFATAEARSIIPHIQSLIENCGMTSIIFTRDTHTINQISIETSQLPQHCIKETPGWCIIDELAKYSFHYPIVDKKSYGTFAWENNDTAWNRTSIIEEDPGSFTLVGVCTDICVISNALILRAMYPKTPITVDAAGCAGTTPENHKKALDIMKNNSIEIINE